MKTEHMFVKIGRRLPQCVAVLLVVAAGVHAQNLKVMSSGGFSAAYKILAPDFERSTGVHIDTVWGPSMGDTPGAIPVRLAKGEAADVLIMVRSSLDELAKKGEVVEGSQVDLARSRIGMAVKTGAVVPDISTVEAFRRALVNAKSVAYSDSASGVYIASQLYKKLGIEKEMVAKSRQIPAEPVAQVVARGEAEIGFQQMSELQPIAGITIVGPIPEELQQITMFSAGVVTRSTSKSAAHALIQFLASAQACPAIKETALDPVACAPTATAANLDPLGQLHIPYGEPVKLDDAKKAADAPFAKARKNIAPQRHRTVSVGIDDNSAVAPG
jgi:molybdate transport system substrate-binding protein